MAEHVVSHGTHILRNHIAAVLDEGISPGCLGKRDAGTWTAAKGNHILDVGQTVTLRITGGEDDVGNVLLYLLVDVNLAHYLASLRADLRRCSHG